MILKRLAIVVLILTFFLGLLAHVGIELNYSAYKPRNPETQNGRTIWITINHGQVVYVNEQELQQFRSVQTAGSAAMLIAFIGIAILKLSVKNVWN